VEAMIPAHRRADVQRDGGEPLLEVTYANGDKEVLYFKDFNSGAMIENSWTGRRRWRSRSSSRPGRGAAHRPTC